jgi:4-amino-4-deoxy-L-arabinose transferase-like glycosyltransferase
VDPSNTLQKIRAILRDRRSIVTGGLLLAILLLGGFLRFYHLGEAGVGNTYYAATVKSMLVSWKNFFFAAFEPGGSLSVDKPPVGFWIEAISARIFGVNGFALALPNAVAGLLSIGMVFVLLRRPFGPWIGLIGALALAVMPVAISTERNNTIDGMLVFVLLLAAWAFVQTAYTNRIRWLFLGTCLVGLGFNIKMLQAFLPLPAFFAVFFFGVKKIWWKKILWLSAATILLLIVSLSWAVAVDRIPATDRPYVDSTSENSVLELVFGHNGIERLINLQQSIGMDDQPDGAPRPADIPSSLPQGDFPPLPAGQNFTSRPNAGFNPPVSGTNGSLPNGQSASMDFGSPGTLRLFTEPLAGEASWLLPFALGGLIILAVALRKRPAGGQPLALILFAGWLLPEAIYFTYSQGLMHAYYLIMLGAPIAALTGMTIWGLWQILRTNPLRGWILAVALASATLTFQAYTLAGKAPASSGVLLLAGLALSMGVLFSILGRSRISFRGFAIGLALAALLIAPTTWSALTTLNSIPNSGLPYAGPAQQGNRMGISGQDGGTGGDNNLLAFLISHTAPGTYLLATERASDAAPYILSTGRPVLTFGGFLGEYIEVSVEQLSTLVKNGLLRYVLLGQEGQRYQEISQWVQQNCTVVDASEYGGANGSAFGGDNSNARLYECSAP